LSRQFSKEEEYMANKYIKECLASIKKMQIITLRFHLTSVRIAKIKKTNSIMLEEMTR
jgi:hypothetical protein